MPIKSNNWIQIDHSDGSLGRDYSPRTIANTLGIDRRTAERWSVTGIPGRLMGWLRLILLGELPWPGWRGWRIGDGWLQGPEGRPYEVSHLNATWIMWQQLGDARQRNAALAQQIAAMRLALRQRRDSTPWHRRQPPRPRQLTIFDHPQKSPA